jgi:hypothetical protein
MKAATYPDADHIAATNPMTNATPEAPRSRWMFSIALVRICLVVPGATVLRLWISDWVTECPSSPTSETITTSIGKMASTP